MSEPLPFLLRFYLPLFVALMLVVLVVASPKFLVKSPDSTFETELYFGVLGIKIKLPLWVKKVVLVRTILLTMAGASTVAALSTNFARYFPSQLNVDVYFDIPGIERSLAQLDDHQLGELTIAHDWQSLIPQYDERVEKTMSASWRRQGIQGVPGSKEFNRDLLHARGSLTFVIDRVGPLSYKILASDGLLKFDLDVPQQTQRHFRSEFHLRETAANHLRPALFQFLRSPVLLIHPEFKQVISPQDPSPDAPFDHIVIGATQVTLLPVPSFSSTVYLWKFPDGLLVPVAYGVYF